MYTALLVDGGTVAHAQASGGRRCRGRAGDRVGSDARLGRCSRRDRRRGASEKVRRRVEIIMTGTGQRSRRQRLHRAGRLRLGSVGAVSGGAARGFHSVTRKVSLGSSSGRPRWQPDPQLVLHRHPDAHLRRHRLQPRHLGRVERHQRRLRRLSAEPLLPQRPDGAPALGDDNERAAAVQAAIWYFSDNYVLAAGDPLRPAVAAIVEDARHQRARWCSHPRPACRSHRRRRRVPSAPRSARTR